MLIRAAPALLVPALAAGPAAAGDWPRFRGPDVNAHSGETGLLRSWPAGGPRVLWRSELGSGYSGISVVDGRLYTMFGRQGDSRSHAKQPPGATARRAATPLLNRENPNA